jgi:hypothetical protein
MPRSDHRITGKAAESPKTTLSPDMPEISLIRAFKPTFKGYWHMVMIFRFDTVLKATQTSSLGQKRLS